MPDPNLNEWLAFIYQRFLTDVDYHPVYFDGPFGKHGCTYGVDEDGCKYVTIGYNMPEHIFAEIEDGTYGNLQGWRIYYDPADQVGL